MVFSTATVISTAAAAASSTVVVVAAAAAIEEEASMVDCCLLFGIIISLVCCYCHRVCGVSFVVCLCVFRFIVPGTSIRSNILIQHLIQQFSI